MPRKEQIHSNELSLLLDRSFSDKPVLCETTKMYQEEIDQRQETKPDRDRNDAARRNRQIKLAQNTNRVNN